MELFFPAQQMHGRDEPDESKEMVAVQVADKNVVDAGRTQLIATQLHLRSLSAIDQKKPLIHIQ